MRSRPEVRLGQVATKIGSGATPRGGKEVYVDEGVAFIRSQNVYDHGFSPEGLAHISDEAAEALRGVAVERGDVLICITGESVTRCCLVPEAVLPARVSQHVAIIRPDEHLDSRFLLAILQNRPFKARLDQLSSAGATRRALTKGHLEGLAIPLPPIEEQRRIAGVLGALDDLIETNERLTHLMEESALAQFVALGFDREGPSQLQSHVDLNPRYPVPRGPVSFVPMAAVREGTAGVAEIENRDKATGTRFTNGDTLLARITPCLENGKTAYVDFLADGEVGCGSTEFVVMRGGPGVPGEWVYCLARSSRFREFAIQHMSGTSGRQRVGKDSLARFRIVVPPRGQITRFERGVRPLFEAMRSLREEGSRLRKTRDQLLPLLLSGRVSPGEVAA